MLIDVYQLEDLKVQDGFPLSRKKRNLSYIAAILFEHVNLVCVLAYISYQTESQTIGLLYIVQSLFSFKVYLLENQLCIQLLCFCLKLRPVDYYLACQTSYRLATAQSETISGPVTFQTLVDLTGKKNNLFHFRCPKRR